MKAKLTSVFNSMSASYKAYWFIGLLECVNDEGLTEIPIKRICTRMLVNAWYPVHFFKLSYGVQDLISQHNILIKEMLNLDAKKPKDQLLDELYHSDNIQVNNLIMHFYKNVTFRFLSPWIKYKSDKKVIADSQNYAFGAPYAINREKVSVIINPYWINYLKENYGMLKDYGYWKLAQYIQAKNPGVPDIINKLIKPATRTPLTTQRNFWNIVFDQTKSIQCIYTNKILYSSDYAVEHYIPWSFTAHNLIWNLLPADSSINSSKGNKLPNDEFLNKFVLAQKNGIKEAYRVNPSHKLFDDYAVFGLSIPELINLDKNNFTELFFNLMKPQLQIAKQLGFQEWKYSI